MQSVLEPPVIDFEVIAKVEALEVPPTPPALSESLVEAQARLRQAIDAEVLTSLKHAAAILRSAGWPRFDHYATYTREQLNLIVAGSENLVQAVESGILTTARARETTPNPALKELSRGLEENLKLLASYANRVRNAASIKSLLQDLRTVIPAQSAADLPDLVYTFPIQTARTVLAEEGFAWPDRAVLDYDEETGWVSVRFELDVTPEAAVELDARIDARVLKNGLRSVPISFGVYGTAVSADWGSTN